MVSRGGNYYPYQYCVATINQEGQLSLTAQLYDTSDYTMDSFSASLIDYLANANMVIVDDRKRHEMAFRKLGECSKSWRHTLIDIQKTLIGFDDLFANQPHFFQVKHAWIVSIFSASSWEKTPPSCTQIPI